MIRIPSLTRPLLALVLLSPLAWATHPLILVEGPVIPGETIEFGLHDDFLGAEICGSTCFAPTLFQVYVPTYVTDTPLSVAIRIARAINRDPQAQAEGYLAAVLPYAGDKAVMRILGPRDENYRVCVDFQHISDQQGCCPSTTWPAVTFTCKTRDELFPTDG